MRAQHAAVAVVEEAVHRGDVPLQRQDDLVHRDLRGGAGQQVAAVGAARRLDDAGLLQQRGDPLQVGQRQRLRLRDGLERERLAPPWRPSCTSSRTPYSAFVVKIIGG